MEHNIVDLEKYKEAMLYINLVNDMKITEMMFISSKYQNGAKTYKDFCSIEEVEEFDFTGLCNQYFIRSYVLDDLEEDY